MRLTIIANDKCIGLEGVFYGDLDLSSLDASIHAVQWYGAYGEIEFKSQFENGQIVKPQNQIIADVTPYQWAVDAWNAAKAAEDAAIAAAAEAEAAQAQTPT